MNERDMSSWNFRIMQYRDGHPKFAPYTHGIHEVYYTEDGSVKTWTEDAVSVVGFDQDDLTWRLQAMLDALTKPTLEYEPISSD